MNTSERVDSTEKHIMVVDDDRYLLMAIDQTLTLNGYSVKSYTSPLEALEEMSADEYAAVITRSSQGHRPGIAGHHDHRPRRYRPGRHRHQERCL